MLASGSVNDTKGMPGLKEQGTLLTTSMCDCPGTAMEMNSCSNSPTQVISTYIPASIRGLQTVNMDANSFSLE